MARQSQQQAELFSSIVPTPKTKLKPAAYLNPGLRVVLSLPNPENHNEQTTQEFYSQTGLSGYVLDLMQEMEGTEATPLFSKPILIKGERDGVSMTAALVLSTETDGVNLHSYANSIRTSMGGTHETGFKSALTRAINDFVASGSGSTSNGNSSSQSQVQVRGKGGAATFTKGKPAAKGKASSTASKSNSAPPPSYKAEVIQQGLYAVIAVQMPRPQFTSQTKEKLSSGEVEGIVRSIVGQGLADWFALNPKPGREWLKRIEFAQKARDEAMHYEQQVRKTRAC
jgi:DNA gyrase subunit B